MKQKRQRLAHTHFFVLYLMLSMVWGCAGQSAGKRNLSHKNPGLSFTHTIVDSLNPQNPWAKMVGDINHDGYPDIIIGGQNGPLVWYRNPDWEKFTIVNGGYKTVDGEVGDIDGDGDADVVMGGIFWYENPGGLATIRQSSWKTHQIANHPTHDVELADLNGDGKIDVVTRNQSDFGRKAGNQIHIWMQHNNGWEERVIQCTHGEGVDVNDVDNDSDPDIVIGGIWYENDGEGSKWTEHFFTGWHSSAAVKVVDLNKDGRADIVLAPAELKDNFYRISWFEQPDSPDGLWKEHLIQDDTEAVVHGIDIADFNNDGLPDIVLAEMHQGQDPDEVIIFINKAYGNSWEKLVISSKGSHLIQAADINADGNIDIMGANWSGDYQPVELWLNEIGN